MYVTRKKLLWACAIIAGVVVILALGGCGKVNPPWGGSAW